MGGLVGLVRLDGEVVDRAILNRWQAGIHGVPPDRVDAGGAFAFAAWAPTFAPDEIPTSYPLRSGATVVAEGRLDDRAGLRAVLSLDDAARSDPALIAAACDRWGSDAPGHLYGEFALAHWDPAERRLTLARDAIGVRALFYHFDGQSVAFATALHHLLAMPQVRRDLDELALADFMVGATEEPERTIYRHIHRVPAGGTARFTQGVCRTAQYWTLDSVAPVRLASGDAYVEASRERLDAAVESRIPATGNVASMLSGGFDSAAATATAAQLLGDRRLTAFTRVAGAYNPYTQFDEKALAGKVAARYANIDWVVVDPVHRAERDISPEIEGAMMGMPTNGFPMTWFEPLHQRAEQLKIRTLFSGSLGNATLSWTGNALAYEQARAGRWLAASRTGKRATLAALEPRGLRRWRRMREAGANHYWRLMTALSPDFLSDLRYGEHARSPTHDIVRDVPLSGRERRWTMLHAEDRYDRLAYARGTMRHEMVDPYTDRRLVEFTLGVPEDQYQRDGVRRWLARRTLADRLPADLLAQQGRGRQVGEWYHLGNLRREQTAQAVEALAASPLASRVLDVAFLKTLVDSWPADADSAIRTERQHRYVLHYSVAVGAFLRWYEGQNG